ncbi:ATP synthase gamma chain [Alicyclobacillus cellulosilyticus]|uniref:ATP synthase gamma chain n=1 Tax=Alicyclobacillus cellulosilyticus TaxID=1003997 RepID=A0A917KE83_9BACL|nr:ATP synthase F1 subunit gamma [Alicyclobacillus cellulosilyticus]GGJ10964.1 ATP synthase gamma chain [Alicyclobacillus cellulosilyticus]
MPQNARDIRRRIKSVRNTAQITKAMEMVAAAKLRRVQEAVQHSKPYLARMQEMLAHIAGSAHWVKHPLLAQRPVRRTGYLVITADRGLAGAYNAQVIRTALQEFRHKDKSTYTIFAAGRRGRDFFQRHGYPLAGEITGLPDSPTYASVRPLAEAIVRGYAEEQFDELYLIYNEFVNAVTQRPVVKKVLPLSDVSGETRSRTQFLFEPDAETVLKSLLPRYAETLVYQAVLDAKASEHGARMTAMGNATDAAEEMIESLTLSLNRARQAAITTQIVEVVSGAEALK